MGHTVQHVNQIEYFSANSGLLGSGWIFINYFKIIICRELKNNKFYTELMGASNIWYIVKIGLELLENYLWHLSWNEYNHPATKNSIKHQVELRKIVLFSNIKIKKRNSSNIKYIYSANVTTCYFVTLSIFYQIMKTKQKWGLS